MTSGGPRARSGRAPEADALRRDRPGDQATWTHLPAVGRQGEAPAWPLSRPLKRELVVWADEWQRPQAVMWEQRGQQREVALYVRALIAAEDTDASPAARVLVLRFWEDLGISQAGLARNRWIIDAAAPVSTPLAATGTDQPSARDRMRVLQGGS